MSTTKHHTTHNDPPPKQDVIKESGPPPAPKDKPASDPMGNPPWPVHGPNPPSEPAADK